MPSVLLQATARPALDPWQLVLDATPVVKLVILVLILMAVACWYVIGAKLVRLHKLDDQSRRFLQVFWKDEHTRQWDMDVMGSLNGQLSRFASSPIATVFGAGYAELGRIARTGTPDLADVDNLERALKRAQNAELTRLENQIPWLASTGSTAPFIGLFGTVWGIMNAFIQLHGQQSATLDAVAPGIAEALIATAIGLVAAIPAVLAYNYFVRRLRVVESEVEAFASDYLNIIRRHLLVD
ncbi:MAG: MotA/TolQ/ExbB proton channel family protein [Sandaracinaceae bacterium]|jgi:biopolymer transport protein TolQ|nr:MotA/TolQ/ExbB proton channel family protein [Sandaracinaceae bacterium]MBP7681230.1 MotA/TolQ/ExbB proton channel family protein [Deltaproteobacteria bacterium]MBK6812977.1 MotA/TolQ/ExbB proton channel family protein [Sandaracinaceae bacterium]MBK7152576.1 MotA/TolQ/ExbB proton channel family protein [Sandaracinaceae bacterium]MBK7773801.1 MotA/TolQ/ExbB proton channel family protein [Sandaracinaceae bacterium]